MKDRSLPRPFLILLNGHAGCLKTTLSYLLASSLQAAHVSTSLLGSFVSDRESESFLRLRDERYQKAIQIIGQFLSAGSSVVADGTFALHRWREPVYRLAQEYDVEEVVALSCTCGDVSKLDVRFQFRRDNVEAPDSEADSVSAYYGSVKEFQPLGSDSVPSDVDWSLVHFDSCTMEVRTDEKAGWASLVAEQISLLIREGLLSTPLFRTVSTRNQTCRNHLVFLEGIGGSGKSTQATLLGNKVRHQFAMEPLVRNEFSASALGRFIGKGLRSGIRVAPTTDPLSQNFAVITDLAGWFLAGAKERRPPIQIFDSGILSRVAHLDALRTCGFPDDAWQQLLTTTRQVLERTVVGAARTITVFLDCPAEQALERLRTREQSLTPEDETFVLSLDRAYRRLLQDRQEIFVVDARGEPEEVHQNVDKALQNWWRW